VHLCTSNCRLGRKKMAIQKSKKAIPQIDGRQCRPKEHGSRRPAAKTSTLTCGFGCMPASHRHIYTRDGASIQLLTYSLNCTWKEFLFTLFRPTIDPDSNLGTFRAGLTTDTCHVSHCVHGSQREQCYGTRTNVYNLQHCSVCRTNRGAEWY